MISAKIRTMQDRDLGYRGLTPEQRRFHPNFNVVAQGNSGPKNIEGVIYQATPSLLVDKDGGFFLGCALPQKGSFYNALWGRYPETIRGWRALRFLEDVPVVDNTGLSAIWAVAHRQGLRDIYNSDIVASLIGGEQKLHRAHEDIMSRGPSSEELEQMILRTQQAGVNVEGWELKREAEAGIVRVTPLIEGIIKDAEAQSAAARAKLDRQDTELKVPLPPNESLGKLLQQLEIGNIILGVPFGAYELDWGFTPAERVDRDLKWNSFYGDHTQPLSRSTKVITFESEEILPGVTQTTPTIGEIVPISWLDEKTNTRVIFQEARFANGHVYLTTKTEGITGQVEEIVYTVSEFRHKFGLTV